MSEYITQLVQTPGSLTPKLTAIPSPTVQHLLLLVAIAALHAPVEAAFQARACIGAPNPGLFFSPSPVSCDQYVRCLNGGTTIDHCPSGFHFNAPEQSCRPIGHVDCTRCGATGTVNLADPQNCRAFFECQFGHRTARLCNAGQLFDRRVGVCNQQHLVQCNDNGGGGGGGGTNPPSPVCPTNGHVFLPHWNDCTRFYECFFGQRTERQCPNGLLFDNLQRQCVSAHLANCNGGGGQPAPPQQPPPPSTQCPATGTTAIPHPTDCTRYFRCANGVRFEERCPNTAPHFNARRLVCDSVQNAQCFRG